MKENSGNQEIRKLDFSLISKVTENCNLNCGYCYLAEKKNLKMSEEVAESLIKSFLKFNNDFAHFTWIGGEPLLMPDSFFTKIMELEEKYNYKNIPISNSIQTNGIALTPARFDRLKDLGYKIGISYDGAPDLQNQRMTESQTNKLLEMIEYAKGKAGLLAVLTKNTIGREKEIYDFFREYTTWAKVNFYSPTGHGAEKEDELMLNPDEASKMMVNLYDLWKNDSSPLELRPMLENVRSFFTGFPVACDFSAVSCYKILGSDTKGDIYPCSKAMNFPYLKMGNINEGLDNLVGNKIHKMPLERYIGLKKKGGNPWLHLSSGGCPIEALSHKGDYMKATTYSEGVRNTLFERIKEDMQNENTRKHLERKVGLIR
ncbi:MAG TPA: radical SAM protein [Candidatus Pacearchaeota archaeon]|nr:radical SAM protein [Candidatus Pacearchaeota archaeon]